MSSPPPSSPAPRPQSAARLPRASSAAPSAARTALLVGAAVVGFLALGFWALSRQAINGRWVEGAVVEKLFTPQPEQQIDIGKAGVSRREVKGTYRLVVRGDDGRDYTVFVGEAAYHANAPGSRIRFLRPPPEPSPQP